MPNRESKIFTAEEAVADIQDGAVIAVNGFIMSGAADELLAALEKRFLETGHPRDLTLVLITSVGDGQGRGADRLAHEGLISRIISSHYSFLPRIQKLILDEKLEAYDFPQGVMSQLLRDRASGNPLTVTPLGLGTFVDPRLDGGRLNSRTTESLNKIYMVDGSPYIRYKSLPPIDFAFVRGSYADGDGNVAMRREGAMVDAFVMSQAARNSGGKVLCQVAETVSHIPAPDVRLPSIMTDRIIPVSDMKYHMQSAETIYNPAYSGEIPASERQYEPVTNPERRIILNRCLKELIPGAVINLGIGMPEGIAALAAEKNLDDYTLTVDVGIIGGTPAGGRDFGSTVNPSAILFHSEILDFFHGGGLDQAFLGLAEADSEGNVNVSRFKGRITGIGGFVDLTQSARNVYLIGTFTAKGLKTAFRDGKLQIVQEGTVRKFRREVEQRTFSAARALELHQNVMFITERAVFRLSGDGLVLTEIAPGLDPEKDIFPQMEFRPQVASDLREMDQDLFMT